MPKYRTRDGRTLEWTGLAVCLCTQCEVLFNSPAAFDAHITRATVKNGRRVDHAPKHDHSWMPVNARGLKVTSLYDRTAHAEAAS